MTVYASVKCDTFTSGVVAAAPERAPIAARSSTLEALFEATGDP